MGGALILVGRSMGFFNLYTPCSQHQEDLCLNFLVPGCRTWTLEYLTTQNITRIVLPPNMDRSSVVTLFPGPPRCLQCNTQKRKTQRKMGKTWVIHHKNNVRWMQVGRWEERPNRKNNALDHLFKCSTAVLDLRC